MLGLFAVKSEVLSCSVSYPAELAGNLDLPLNGNALFKDVFAMKPYVSLSEDKNGWCIFSKL